MICFVTVRSLGSPYLLLCLPHVLAPSILNIPSRLSQRIFCPPLESFPYPFVFLATLPAPVKHIDIACDLLYNHLQALPTSDLPNMQEHRLAYTFCVSSVKTKKAGKINEKRVFVGLGILLQRDLFDVILCA